MSRHTIYRPGDSTLVVGWDRPLRYFFAILYQDGEVLEHYVQLEIDDLENAGVPAPVLEQLRLEEAGEVDTNVVKDWRQ